MHYGQKLRQAVTNARSLLCVGLDPIPDRIPRMASSTADPAGQVLAFCLDVVERTHHAAAAYKLNTAFFEALGHNGWRVMEQLAERIPSDRIVILDAKRGDIGHTARHYAIALLERIRCDAVTVNPLMGLETLEPFLAEQGKAVYALALTSNPGASQYLLQPMADNRMLCEHIATDLRTLHRESSGVGMVVGATQPEKARPVLDAFPEAPLLIPGIGAQGGDVDQWKDLLSGHAGIPLFNSSRSILYPAGTTDTPEQTSASPDLFHDPFAAIGQAAERTRDLLSPITQQILSQPVAALRLPKRPTPAAPPASAPSPKSPAPSSDSSSLPVLTVYTDGACSGNPGPGGWAALIRHDGHERQLSGGEPATTNNRMEMRAVLEALNSITTPSRVLVHSDSALIINAFTQGWISRWQRNGWRKADRKPVENQGLWKDILHAMRPHRVEWIKVKGHHDDALNNRVDELAVAESRKFG